MKQVSISTRDGHTLSGTLYEPAAAANKAVLVVCAMGVPQSYYRAFCEWLVEQGCVVLTFDFRGMGQSRNGSLRGLQCDVMTWAQIDAVAALELLAARSSEVPITWVGHSLGGQIFAFTMAHVARSVVPRVKRLTYLAAGSGYWRENSPQLKRVNWIFWFVLGPTLTPLFGYWPGAKLNMVGDLPAGVFYQWKSWCMHREYAVAVLPPQYRQLAKSVDVPITCISFTDDEMMSNENIEALKSMYPDEKMTALRFAPHELGAKRIGHFGAFRKEMRDALWQQHVLPSI
jgi:predicted alpha/beta hydrolase